LQKNQKMTCEQSMKPYIERVRTDRGVEQPGSSSGS
jgi:hypothetical protein